MIARRRRSSGVTNLPWLVILAILALCILPLLAIGVASTTARAQSAPNGGIGLRAYLFHRAAPGANTAIITKAPNGSTITGLTPQSGVGAFRVTIQLATGSVLDATVSDGTTTTTSHLNGGTALTAGCLYTFCFGVCDRVPTLDQNAAPLPLVWNFQIETNGVIDLLQVDEVANGVL